MKKSSHTNLVITALVGLCVTACRGEAPSVTEPPRPAATAHAAHAPDVGEALPILFDYRQVVDAQDISGLTEGTHVVEFDAYAPSHAGWTPQAERSVADGVKVLRVDDGSPASTRVTFEALPDRPAARRVRVEMELTERGTWIVLFGQGMRAAHADPELLASYDVLEPETLRPAGDYEFLNPGLMLRTVGSCNHVRKVSVEADGGGVMRAVRLHFSEPLSPAAVPSGMTVDVAGSDGRHLGSAKAQSARLAADVLELRVPPMRGALGVLSIPLGHVPGFAGRFRDLLSCDAEEGSVGVGYLFGEQTSGELVTSPLQQAAARALGEDRK